MPESAEKIIDAKADYLLAVKNNQPSLYAELENFFDQAHAVECEGVPHLFYKELDKGHGRIESREVRIIEELDLFSQASKWVKLACLIEIRAKRDKSDSDEGELSRRFYLSSRQVPAKDFGK
ncbi:hypothetical protein RSOCI_02045 [Rhabdochlamydiaceae symbiont of Dictyostelium giganteum]